MITVKAGLLLGMAHCGGLGLRVCLDHRVPSGRIGGPTGLLRRRPAGCQAGMPKGDFWLSLVRLLPIDTG